MKQGKRRLSSRSSESESESYSDSDSESGSYSTKDSEFSTYDREATSSAQSNVRGVAKMGDAWASGESLVITFNDYFQPVGKNAKELSSHLGSLARDGNRLPLTYKDWRSEELTPYKERVWLEVKESINAPDGYKKSCLRKIGKLWNNFKSTTKRKFYKSKKNDEERLANRPPQVEEKQWPILVKMWGSHEAKKKSRRNHRSRKKQKTHNTSGRKSHAAVAHEMIRDGVKSSCLDVYIQMHTKKDGRAIDDVSTNTMTKMKERLSQFPQESSNSTSIKNDISNEVMGPNSRGFGRTYGLQNMAANKCQCQTNQIDIESMRQEIRKEFEDQFTQLEAKYEMMQRHLEICPLIASSEAAISLKDPSSSNAPDIASNKPVDVVSSPHHVVLSQEKEKVKTIKKKKKKKSGHE